jgi:hypothetical protein
MTTPPITPDLERVARAIFSKSEHWLVLGADVWETAPKTQRDMCFEQARAAVAALLDVSDDMEEAADDPFHAEFKAQHERSMRVYGKVALASAGFSKPMFQAMLRAVLGDAHD